MMPVRALLRAFPFALLVLLAACGGPRQASLSYAPGRRDYPAPGPADDPWGPYIREAAGRFGVPAQWVRAVMHQESGGHEYLDGEPITSAAGAIGLMQLMPATYADLQAQYGLGSDPFDPHDNIMAGTGYIRQMYDKYGSPGFLAAYNAGPARVDDYLAGDGGLPNETVNYVAAIEPNLGGESAGAPGWRSGPAPAAVAPEAALAAASPAASDAAYEGGGSGACWHDPNAAYDPGAPCGTPPPVALADASTPAIAAPASAGCAGDPDVAYDEPCPPRPAAYASVAAASAVAATVAPATGYAAPPYGPTSVAASAYAPPYLPGGYRSTASTGAASARPYAATDPVHLASTRLPPRPAAGRAFEDAGVVARGGEGAGGAWAIQVGAFGRPAEAFFAQTMAREAAPRALAGARNVVLTISGLGGHALYRARLAGIDRAAAADACDSLHGHALACILVAPGG